MKVVVDTNIVFSAILNTNSRIANLLIQSPSKINFYTTDQLLDEINKHSDKLIKLSGYSKEELQRLIFLLTKRISFISRLLISEESYQFAETLTSDIDEDDIEFVALTHQIGGKLWSGDKKLLAGLEKKGWRDFTTVGELWELRTKFES